MKAKLCLKNLFIVSTLILIAFAASSCTVNADPPVYYTITAAEEIENGTISVDKTSATSGETVKITATADDTYELSALSVTDEKGNAIPVTDGSFTMPEGNVVVSATFASIFHNIFIAQDIENGTVSVDKESAAQGETITVTAEPNEGYLLNSIHVTDADGNEITVTENTFTMPKAHVTVSATFGIPIIIAETIENGSVSTVKNSAMAGESVQIETVPLEGYELSSLTVTDAGGKEIAVTEKTFTMPESAVSISATFSLINYRLSIADGIQHGSVSLDKTTATMGETISITISSATGYQLVRLNADSSNGAAVEITDNTFVMPAADVNVSAEFSAIQYAVNIAGGISHGSVSLDKTSAIIGETVSISTTPAKEYVLDAISVTDLEGNAVTVTENSFTMPASSVTVSATFLLFRLKTGQKINSILVKLGAGWTYQATHTATQFLPSENPPSESDTAYTISTDESDIPVYVWLNGTAINYYAPTKLLIPLNPNSSELFYKCDNLKTIDLSGFDTSSVTDMSSMFCYCSRLTSLDLSGLDTSSVTSMYSMFSGCRALTSVDLSGLDTSSVTNMDSMFWSCSGLTSLDLSGLDTSSVKDMGSMFRGCSGLTSLDLSGFDTSRVWFMSSMFSGCSGLTSVDLSGFDTSSVWNMSSMFNSCSKLTTIYVSSAFNTNSVTDSLDMFDKCTSLKGGEGTAYDSDKTDKTYARIDGGTSAPGYFTKKIRKNFVF